MEEPELPQLSAEMQNVIAALSRTSDSARDIAIQAGFKMEDVGKQLRDYRRKFALMMFGHLAPELYNYTNRYYAALDRVLHEIEQRDVTAMDLKELLRVHDSLLKWITAINQGIALAPRDSGVEGHEGRGMILGRPDVSMTEILTIVQKRHEISPKEQRKKQRRLARLTRGTEVLPNEPAPLPEKDEPGNTDEETTPESSRPSPDELLRLLHDPPPPEPIPLPSVRRLPESSPRESTN